MKAPSFRLYYLSDRLLGRYLRGWVSWVACASCSYSWRGLRWRHLGQTIRFRDSHPFLTARIYPAGKCRKVTTAIGKCWMASSITMLAAKPKETNAYGA